MSNLFRVDEVAAGWFRFTLSNGVEEFSASCSRYGEVDVAQQLVLLAHRLVTAQPVAGFLCLNGEAEAYRMGTHREGLFSAS